MIVSHLELKLNRKNSFIDFWSKEFIFRQKCSLIISSTELHVDDTRVAAEDFLASPAGASITGSAAANFTVTDRAPTVNAERCSAHPVTSTGSGHATVSFGPGPTFPSFSHPVACGFSESVRTLAVAERAGAGPVTKFIGN
jgi:hypothetical protein